jgi:ankyrin repeat protein
VLHVYVLERSNANTEPNNNKQGNTDVVQKLLGTYGADPNLADIHGSTALYEAAKNGHEDTMQVLLNYKASLCMDEALAASTLCQVVFDGDVKKLRRLLKSGIHVDASDYDSRTASHIAVRCCDERAAVVLILVLS